jgi:hypothetical protein
MPVTVTHLGGAARRIDDIGKEHRGKNPVVSHFWLFAGEERVDLLKGLPPRCSEVEQVAPWHLNEFRAPL